MNVVHVWWADIQQLEQQLSFAKLLDQLPEALHPAILHYHFEKDRYVRAVSKYLLQKLLTYLGFDQHLLLDLHKGEFGKPLLPLENFSFNISHARNLVLCAASLDCKVGVDIEYVRPIEIKGFEENFTRQEWRAIIADHSLNVFYTNWTKKESVIKADGRGLQLSLGLIDTLKNPIKLDNVHWYLQHLPVPATYKATICTSQALVQIKQKQVMT